MTWSNERIDGELPSLSSSLLNQVQEMQPEAWSRLTSVFSPIVYRWSRESGLCAADSADIVQDVFVAVARNIPTFERKKEQASFRSWLATITRNKVRDRFRQIHRGAQPRGGTEALDQLNRVPADSETQSTLSGAIPQPEAGSDELLTQVIDPKQLESRIPARVLKIVQENCDAKTWQAFCLTTISERPAAEVAQELGISVSSVYQAKSRVLRRIRARMDELP